MITGHAAQPRSALLQYKVGHVSRMHESHAATFTHVPGLVRELVGNDPLLTQKQEHHLLQQSLCLTLKCFQRLRDEIVFISAHVVILDVEFDPVITITDSQPFQGFDKLRGVPQQVVALSKSPSVFLNHPLCQSSQRVPHTCVYVSE